jgi:hypothetical protein
MAVTPLNYDDIVDFRFDRWANGGQGEFQPIGIGFASVGFGSKAAEVRQVPASAPYVIKLYEVPYQLTASATEILDGVTTLNEVSQSVSTNQYRVAYYDIQDMGEIEFNKSQAGKEVTISYYGLGHTLQKISLDTRVPDSGNTTIAGIKTFSSSPVFSAGSQRGELGITLKEKIIEIGDWNMDTTGAVNVAHGLGANYRNTRLVFVMIRHDSNSIYTPLYGNENTGDVSGSFSISDATNLLLYRVNGGFFDNAGYDSTSYNRGWIYILYTG